MDPDFDEFVRARTASLLRAAYLLTGDQQHHGEDLVQTALARTHRAWRRLRRSGNEEAYTRKIMYNLQARHWRRRRFTESELTNDVREPERGDTVETRIDLRRALHRLAPRQRAVIVLRFFEDRTEAETADLLGCSIGTVKSQSARPGGHRGRGRVSHDRGANASALPNSTRWTATSCSGH